MLKELLPEPDERLLPEPATEGLLPEPAIEETIPKPTTEGILSRDGY
jgi:hypothetical protein